MNNPQKTIRIDPWANESIRGENAREPKAKLLKPDHISIYEDAARMLLSLLTLLTNNLKMLMRHSWFTRHNCEDSVVIFICMVFLRCMEPVVIQQRDQQLYVTSEPRREWTSITRNTHRWLLNGMAENRTRATEMASEHQTDHAFDGLLSLWINYKILNIFILLLGNLDQTPIWNKKGGRDLEQILLFLIKKH